MLNINFFDVWFLILLILVAVTGTMDMIKQTKWTNILKWISVCVWLGYIIITLNLN